MFSVPVHPDDCGDARGLGPIWSRSPVDSKDIRLVHPKGNQSWVFIGSTDAEAEAPILWPPDVKSWLTGKTWGQKEKEEAEVRWWNSLTDSVDMNLSELQETMKDRRPWCAAVRGVEKSQTWLSNWTTTTDIYSESKHEKKKGISWILPLPSLPTAVYFIQFIQFSTQSIILNHITSQPKLLLKRLLSLWLLF